MTQGVEITGKAVEVQFRGLVVGCITGEDENLGTFKREVGWVTGFEYIMHLTSFTLVKLALIKGPLRKFRLHPRSTR